MKSGSWLPVSSNTFSSLATTQQDKPERAAENFWRQEGEQKDAEQEEQQEEEEEAEEEAGQREARFGGSSSGP